MWHRKKILSEVCKNLDNKRIAITKKDRVEGCYPYYGASGIVDYVGDYIFDDDLLLVSEDGANLLARTYPIAFSASGKYWVNNHAHVLKFESPISQKFIEYYLNSISLIDFISGMAQPKLNQKALNSIPVPFPSLETQKQIVAKLDQAFAEIEKAKVNAEQNLKNARELFESYFQQVFNQSDDYHERELGDVCNFLNGYAFKSKDAVDKSDTQLIRMGNLYKNQLNLERKPSFYPSSYASEYKKFTLREGDLVMSLTGTVGKEDYGYTVEIPKFDGHLLLNQRIVKFIEIDETLIERRFLFRILRSRIFLDKLYESANGTRQANLSTVTMKKLKISVPNILKQKELIDIFDNLEQEIESLCDNYKCKIQALNELKQSILQKAFKGELT